MLSRVRFLCRSRAVVLSNPPTGSSSSPCSLSLSRYLCRSRIFDPAQPIGLDFTVQGVNDENRYSVSRGAHRNLKRAERSRIAVNKIPALVDSLIAKTRSWEDERRKVFLYDEVPLLAMLEEYNLSRQEKEEEKQRQRKINLIAEKKSEVKDEPVGRGRCARSKYRAQDRTTASEHGEEDEQLGEGERTTEEPHDREIARRRRRTSWGRGRGEHDRERGNAREREHGKEDHPGVGEHDRERIRERESKPIQRGKKNQAVGVEE
ncbi:hypothetical protein Syun_019463 [Stephania yunnanensis]|uniref:Uncharacterized protein n=1 Tax=Stephania yunnanensis TaxID=152371 RepID=A0AAP0IWK0_9MAGN